MKNRVFIVLLGLFAPVVAFADPVATVDELVAAVRDGGEGSAIEIAAGTFELTAPLEPKAGMTLKGAGVDETIIDHGNLISGFGKAPAKGPAAFHNNLVSNPGRGVIWINEPYDNLTVRNNHIVTRTTSTLRTVGLFGFHAECDFGTFRIVDNIVECRGTARPLLRRDESYAATIRNNSLTNVSDMARYENPQHGEVEAGLEEPLSFRCGVHGELSVDGWRASATVAR